MSQQMGGNEPCVKVANEIDRIQTEQQRIIGMIAEQNQKDG
jgi:hypothetical protein